MLSSAHKSRLATNSTVNVHSHCSPSDTAQRIWLGLCSCPKRRESVTYAVYRLSKLTCNRNELVESQTCAESPCTSMCASNPLTESIIDRSQRLPASHTIFGLHNDHASTITHKVSLVLTDQISSLTCRKNILSARTCIVNPSTLDAHNTMAKAS